MKRTITKIENYLRRNGIKWYLFTFSLLSLLFLITIIVTTWNIHIQYYTSCTFKVSSYNIHDLPKNVMPLEYNVTLNPKLSLGLFDGFVNMKFNVLKPTGCVVLHAKNLTITNVLLDGHSDVVLTSFNNSIVVIHFTGILPNFQNHTLALNYTGNIKNAFFSDQKYEILMTKNHQLSSSEWFPCFDQVEWRTNFVLQMNISEFRFKTIISNMPHKIMENDTLTFDRSPPITTAQIGFFIGNFAKIQVKNNFTMYSTDPKDVPFLDDVIKCTDFFENFFNSSLDYPKFDILHYDDLRVEKYGILATERQYTCEMISRRWNGGLFSPSIGHFWLSLGLGKFLSFYSNSKINISENSWENYYEEVLSPYLKMDAYTFSVPLNSQSKKLKEFETRKGSLLFFNFLTYFNEDGIKEVLREFLRRYKYRMVTTENFLSVLNSLYPNQKDITRSWLELPGYPLIQVKQYNQFYEFTQQRFFGVPVEDPGTVWWIPFKYKDSKGRPDVILLDQKGQNITLGYEWIQILPGPYRVNYSEPLWNQLIKNASYFESSERYFLIENSFEMAFASYLNFKIPMNIIRSLKNETSPFVLETIYQKMSFLYNLLSNYPNQYYFKLNSFLRELTSSNKTEVLKLKILLEDDNTIQYFRTKFNERNFTKEERTLVYTVKTRFGSIIDYLEIYEIYQRSNDALEKKDCLFALTQSKIKGTFIKTIQLAIELNQLDLLLELAKNLYAVDDLWFYIRNNHPILKTKFEDFYLLILEISNRFIIRKRFEVIFFD